jgi:carbamoyltransferase
MFRPFSPAILEEHALNYFVMHSRSSQFMSFIAKCKSPELYPAIIHVDGTSRVQTVPKDGSGFRQLLERWYETTGCPMLLNTSLNIKGKPICNTETDAKEFSSMYNVTVFT